MELMLCHTGDETLLDNPRYGAELKADGTHIRAEKADEKYGVFGRPKKTGTPNYTNRLTEVTEALQTIPAADFQIIGEAVVYDENGVTWFEGSQRRCSTQDPAKQILYRAKYPVVMLAFDLTRLDGKDLTNYPYEERKALLLDILQGTPEAIQYLPHQVEGKRGLFNEVVARGEEGLILKKLGSRYERRRSRNWLKVKKWYQERVQVVGFTPGEGRIGHLFGSLVLAKPDDDGFLEYAGKVGSGFSDAERAKVSTILNRNIIDNPPVKTTDPYTPVQVPLEVTVKFYQVSKNGVFRFPSLMKDNWGNTLIHYNDPTIAGRPRPRDLAGIFAELAKGR